jgi:cobalt-zinc-cadmium resistance protein CzcA
VGTVPDITNNQVQIITQAPSLSTVDVEQFITFPVETAMGNLPGIVEIRSVSRFGLSVVTLVFEDGMGTYLPRQLVSTKLNQVREQIPDGFGKPSMGPITTGLGQIYDYTLKVAPEFKDEYSLTELRTFQDWIVDRQMTMVEGVVEVNGFGGNIKQYEVVVNPDKLRAMDITVSDVFTALESNNQNTGGAYIEKNHMANFIRVEGLVRNIEDIENIVIKNIEGIPVTIGDVAEVQTGGAVRYGALTKDGKGEAVGGTILMLKGANSHKVIDRVKERMAQIEKSLPEGVSIEPFLDRSQLIDRTMGTVTLNLVEGGLIVIFILVLLLGNWRGGLIVASTIPLSLLFAFILMNVFDVWANLMSLGAIDFGIIVDGAVIIVEATVFMMYRKVFQKKKIDSEERDKIASISSKKMMNTAFFGQLIILIVFLPILFLEGVEGKMFKPMALTFMFAMIGAMVLCLTYVPMASALFLKSSKNPKKKGWGDKIVLWIENKYEPLLKKSLKRGKAVVILAIGLFALAIFAFTRMGAVFMPQLDEGTISFHIILKPGSSLSESIATSTKVETILLENFPEVKHVITRFGVSEVPTDPMPMDLADSFIILEPESEWVSANSKEELIAKMKEKISVLPGVSYEFTQPIEMRFNELLSGVREDVAIKLFGEDLPILAQKAQEISQIIAGVPGVADMKVEATTGMPQITVHYNREKLAQYGLQIDEMNRLVQTAFAGGKAGVVFEGERRFDLVVRLGEEHRNNISDVENLFVSLPNGASIPLREVAEIGYQTGPMQISRDNTNRRTAVGINIRNRDVKSVVEDIQEKLDAELELPPGYFIRYGGAFENLERATNRLEIVVPIALFLIFILIYFALRSFRQTLMIYIAIPMAAIGGVFALWLRGMPFSISAGIGFIVLFGVAVLNGLVLVSGLNELRKNKELLLKERIAQGTRRRIRPIMLTALTDIFGFLPMAISTSAGAEVQRPLATVVIGGLITATLLTLFVLPVLYKWVEEKQFNLKFNKRIATASVVVGLFCLPQTLFSQEDIDRQTIGLSEAVELSKENQSLLESKKLEVEQAEAMKATAWDFGETQLFTGGEELGNDNPGVYTRFGVKQQGIDVFGIFSKNKLYRQKTELAEAKYQFFEQCWEHRVKNAWANAFIAKRRWLVLTELDSIYQKFIKAAELKYEVESISELELLSAQNKAGEISIRKNQAKSNYEVALAELNLLIGNETEFGVPDEMPPGLFPKNSFYPETLENHPLLAIQQEKTETAKARKKAARAEFLPELNLQYGIQEINGMDGFYNYEIGISVPLFSGASHAASKSAKIGEQISEKETEFARRQLQTDYQKALENFQKWEKSWEFYQQKILPNIQKQRAGSLLAYREGALDYFALIQNLDASLSSEFQALESLDQYLHAIFNLQFYTLNP